MSTQKLIYVSDSEVVIEFANKRRVRIVDDEGGALELAISLTDWSEHWKRIDESNELTNPGVAA